MIEDCFKLYDVRGKVPSALNDDLAYKIGYAFANQIKARNVIVGYDIRLSSIALKNALCRGLNDYGCNVIDIGLCGTEEVYYTTGFLKVDGGLMITASHNPIEYNGIKFVKKNAEPFFGDELLSIKNKVSNFSAIANHPKRGETICKSFREEYIKHLHTYIDINDLEPLKIVMNPGNGCAGPVLDALLPSLPFQVEFCFHEPDGSFPNGVPNPLDPTKRKITENAVISAKADLGLAWDGDFDRCFFYDENGNFIEGYYIVCLISKMILEEFQCANIVHDPRLEWATREIISNNGGNAIRSKTGHALMKQSMRQSDAIYGGEMSAHHYFKSFYYCDSGMIPWLLISAYMSKRKISLGNLINDIIDKYPASGEINMDLSHPDKAIEKVVEYYKDSAKEITYLDGVSVELDDWRFNLRSSNTEPVVRLNVEARGNKKLLNDKTEEVISLLTSSPA